METEDQFEIEFMEINSFNIQIKEIFFLVVLLITIQRILRHFLKCHPKILKEKKY